MPHTSGQNAGKEAVEIPAEDFWRDFERMQELPASFRHWLEYEANDTYQIGPIFQYHMWHGRTFGELEAFMKHYSRQQYTEDYVWTGETPPQKGKTNEHVSQLRITPALGRQSGKETVQVRRPMGRKRRASLANNPVDNDGDYYSPY